MSQISDMELLDKLFESIDEEDLKKCSYHISLLHNINEIHPQFGFGAIHVASAIPSTKFAHELFKSLLKHKADFNLVSAEEYTPLDVATSNNRINTVKYLLKHGAKPNEHTLELAQEFNNATCESLIKAAMTSSSSSTDYDTDTLVSDLKKLGLNPGPITNATKSVYLNYRTKHAQNSKAGATLNSIIKDKKIFSIELETILLKETEWKLKLDKYTSTAIKFVNYFEKNQTNQSKSFFTYLLLNSKITNNLPAQKNVKEFEAFKIFLNSIFYIGKGTNNRPHDHLREAKVTMEKNLRPKNDKIRKILSLWNENLGIICLSVFHNVTSDEAFSREYAMISAIGLNNLTNEIESNFYSGLKWTGKEKRQLGCYLLNKAFGVYMNEGERPVLSNDIKIK